MTLRATHFGSSNSCQDFRVDRRPAGSSRSPLPGPVDNGGECRGVLPPSFVFLRCLAVGEGRLAVSGQGERPRSAAQGSPTLFILSYLHKDAFQITSCLSKPPSF